MRITLLRNTVSQPEGKKYKVVDFGYKTEEGKVKGLRVFSFVAEGTHFKTITEAKVGDILEATFKQNDKGYWEINTLKPTGEVQAVAANDSKTSTGAARGNWETSDERAARQVMIVRQSSLSTAQALLEANKVKAEPEDVVKVARVFEAYVLDKPVQTGEVE